MRKVFLDDLPRFGNRIDWVKSVGSSINFIYDNVSGIIDILDYDKRTRKIRFKYDNVDFEMMITPFVNCNFKNIVQHKEIKFLNGTRVVDISGKTYNKLKVVELDKDRAVSKRTYWKCKCECGNIVSVESGKLKSNHAKSCGCIRAQSAKNRSLAIAIKNNNTFEDWCLENDHQDYLDLWDYELNAENPNEISYASGFKYYFKCSKGTHESELYKLDQITTKPCSPTCRKCNSFGQYLLDTYGSLDMWSDQNKINPFEIAKGSSNKVWVKCIPECLHPDYFVTCSHFTGKKETRCPICSSNKIVNGLNDFETLHPNLMVYIYDKSQTYGLSEKSDRMVDAICPTCESVKKIRLNCITNNQFRCDVCSDGLPYTERLMANILINLKIKFKKEYSPKWAIDHTGSQRRYDFYIPSKKIIIEIDGGWHEKDNLMNGQTAEESNKIDNWKDKQAELHGIEVVRIKADRSELEYIKNNIIKSALDRLLNLNSVDWTECDKKSVSNLLKYACELWNSGIHSTTEIGEQIGLCSGTIMVYLQRGKKLGLCDYSKEKSDKARYAKLKQLNRERDGKKLIVCETGDMFNSIAELSEKSIELFGVKLIRSSICNVCNGKNKSHKGFTFKYVDEES